MCGVGTDATNQKKYLAELPETEIAWVAGIIEGEGSFVVCKDKRSSYHACRVQCELTDYDTIEQLYNLVGGKFSENKSPSKYKVFPNAKDSWRWALNKQNEVFDLLILIGPYLSHRRRQQASKLYKYLENKLIT